MATGITKREQRSEDALTVRSLDTQASPLPPVDERCSLDYSNKLDVKSILSRASLELVEAKGGRWSPLGDHFTDSFMLADNVDALRLLYQSNSRPTLIYLDPPYGTGFDFHTRDLEHSYNDKMGQAEYVEFMRRRLVLMREVLADDGSIYIHIGHQMVGHLKVLMDEIFGPDNFRNLITRRKCSSKNFTKNAYSNISDYILFYSKGKEYKWNKPGANPEQDWIEREYPKFDDLGRRYKLVPVHAPGTRNGATGQPWRGKMPPSGKHWQYAPAKLDEFDERGDIYWSKNGNPRRKVYWEQGKKVGLTDYWDGFRDAHHQSIRITGYPTEKNFNLLKLIVGASSEEGDLVLDPFAGSGTTLHAARDLKRHFIGIDASFVAAKAALGRLRHGLRRMGDYVDFENKSSGDLPFEGGGGAVRFLADRNLLSHYETELRELAKL